MNIRRMMQLGLLGGKVAPWIPTYLFDDEFTTAQSAPLTTPRTSEPGPGQLTIVDADNVFSIASGSLVKASGPGSYTLSSAITFNNHIPGLAILYFTTYAAGGGNLAISFIADNSDDTKIVAYSRNWNDMPFEGYWTTPVKFAAVYQSNGTFFIINVSTGKLSCILRGINTAPRQLQISTEATDVEKIDYVRIVSQLPPPWNTDYGICTNYVASPSAGQITTSTPDALIEWTTPIFAANDVMELSFRRTDDDNRWILRCDQAGSTIKLFTRIAGTETQILTHAMTFTVGVSYYLWVQFDGTTIHTYTAGNTTAQTFNQTATGVKVSHGGSNLACWPRNVTFPL